MARAELGKAVHGHTILLVRPGELEPEVALRIFIASRHAATAMAQRDFWLEFSWADQEYRVAVHRLAEFCACHRDGSGP